MIELVLHVGGTEWEIPDHNSEQYNSEGKDICLPSIVNLALANLWSHVALGSPEGRELVNVFVGSETEIGELEVHVFVDQNVLKFDVAMHYILTVNIVKLVNNLFCEKSANYLIHTAQLFADVEQELTLYVLHDDVHLSSEVFVVVFDDSIVTVFVHLDDSLVVE